MVDIHDLALAALLHDIGKVMQRGEVDIGDEKYFDRCPTRNGIPSHYHVRWTDEFFDSYSATETYWQEIANLAASHHNASSYANPSDKEKYWLIQCIILADRISSMWDREPDDETKGRNEYKIKQLYSILSDVSLGGKISEKNAFRISERNAGNTSAFPLSVTNVPKCSEYKAVYEKFKGEFDNLISAYRDKKIGKPNLVDAIDSLLEKYFWSVPSNTKENSPTNSLYYHSKISAGIATALFAYYQNPEADKTELKESLIESDKKILLLIGGDLSGIQNYIFDLHPEHSKKAAKILRSRSFKVKTITEIVMQKLITETGLTRQNILMNAGGKFMILAPNTNRIKEYLIDLRKDVDKEFFQEFLGSVSLNIDWSTEICFKDLKKEFFPSTLDRFISNLEIAKQKKYSAYLMSEEKWNTEHFKLEQAVCNSNLCPQCGRRTTDDEICQYCRTEIELGKILPDTTHFIISKSKKRGLISLFNNEWNLHEFLPDKPIVDNDFAFCIEDTAKNARIHYPLKQTAKSLPSYRGLSKEEKQIIDDNSVDEEKEIGNDTLTFDELALLALRKSDENKFLGVPLNAVLKGDVDSLGNIFSLGFLYDNTGKMKANGFSLTQYATLSSFIDWFFSVYTPTLIEKDERFTNKIYTVFAGGDDFCMIGPWNTMLDFAVELDKKFKEYCGGHGDLHFSAALTLMHGKSPIRFVIDKSETELSCAKKNLNKNAIYLFDTVVPWKKYNELMQWADNLSEWIKKDSSKGSGGITTQFLYRLLQYSGMAVKYQEKKEVRDLLYKSYLIYDLKRNMNNLPEQANQLQKLAWEDEEMRLMRVPLHKVIYNNRKYNQR